MLVKQQRGKDNKMPRKKEPIQLQSPEERARIEAINAKEFGGAGTTRKQRESVFKGEPITTLKEEITPKRETIQLGAKEPEKTGIAEFRERDTIAGKLVKIATDWRTTIALLATLVTAGAAAVYIASRGGLAAINYVSRVTARLATPEVIGKVVKTSYIPGGVSAVTPSISGGLATVLTNPKTVALTTKLLVGIGLTLGAASLARDIIGTYPFAAFGKEEALQGIGFPLNKALDAGDIEGAQMILDASNELVNAEPTIIDKIPYANVQKAFAQYVEAQATANIEWQRLIDERQREAVGEGEFESPFEKAAREREERDIQTKADIEESRRVSEETFKRRQEEIQAGVEARDEAERIKFEEITKEREERERLDTLFFEAIRKRNAGIELTEEERQILIDRGVDPEPIKQTPTFRRKSLVQF